MEYATHLFFLRNQQILRTILEFLVCVLDSKNLESFYTLLSFLRL